MKEFKVLIPTADNSGAVFSDETLDKFRQSCINRFGGLTDGGQVAGYWSDGLKVYKDTNVVYYLASKDISEIKALLKDWNETFKQEAFYICEIGETSIVGKGDL